MTDFAASVAKTVMGIVPSFDQLFTGARIVPRLFSDHRRGTAYDYRKGEIFLCPEYATTHDLLPSATYPKGVLACTPIESLMAPRFSRIVPHGFGGPVGPSCLRIIAWRNVGHFLVLVGDPSYIGDEWVAFVPIDQRFGVEA